MLFVTNRTPQQSSRTRINRKITFNLQNTLASQTLFFCHRTDSDEYTEIGNSKFFQTLKADKNYSQVLLYIHGFNNTAERDVFPNAIRLQRLVNSLVPNLVYVVPLIWPCDDDSLLAIVDDYWDDQLAADQSAAAFARLLGKFNDWRGNARQDAAPCTKRISLLAHSMGARVLRGALATWARRFGSGRMPQIFRNVFLVAPDVVNHTLEANEEGQFIPHSARNVVVYYANDDLAMPASKAANLKNGTVSRRLGMTGPSSLSSVPRNVYEADCDDFNNTWDFPKGHTYFLDGPDGELSPALLHMTEALQTGRVRADNRHIALSPSRDR